MNKTKTLYGKSASLIYALIHAILILNDITNLNMYFPFISFLAKFSIYQSEHICLPSNESYIHATHLNKCE